MDIATIFGLIVGLLLIGLGMFDSTNGGVPSTFFQLQGLAIVFGGTFAATLVNYRISHVTQMFKIAGQAFFGKHQQNSAVLIQQFINLSKLARKKGLAELEKELPNIEGNYMKIGIEYAILEKDKDRFEKFLDNELQNLIKRHQYGHELFFNMGSYAPAFGLLGTVMGLILMMHGQAASSTVADFANQSSDPLQGLLKNMGVALVTTFYGVLLSNLFFIPIAGKLQNRTNEEVHLCEMIKIGITGLHQKEHWIMIQEKLFTFIDKETRDSIRQLS